MNNQKQASSTSIQAFTSNIPSMGLSRDAMMAMREASASMHRTGGHKVAVAA